MKSSSGLVFSGVIWAGPAGEGREATFNAFSEVEGYRSSASVMVLVGESDLVPSIVRGRGRGSSGRPDDCGTLGIESGCNSFLC